MSNLHIPESLYTKSLPKRGIITVIGRRILPKGTNVTITDGTNSFDPFVTSIEYKLVSELDIKDAQAEGFAEVKNLKYFIKNNFPTMKKGDIVTIVRWEPLNE